MTNDLWLPPPFLRRSLLAKLECLYAVLHNTCPPNAVRLVMNYFKETLPDGCTFNYESRLQKHIDQEIANQKLKERKAKEELFTFQQDMGRRSSRAGASIQLNRSSSVNPNGTVMSKAVANKNLSGQAACDRSMHPIVIVFVSIPILRQWII